MVEPPRIALGLSDFQSALRTSYNKTPNGRSGEYCPRLPRLMVKQTRLELESFHLDALLELLLERTVPSFSATLPFK